MRFFDREGELAILNRLVTASSKGKFNFVIISGRRGVGKTRLVFEAFEGKVPFLYLFIERKSLDIQIEKFADKLEKVIGTRLPRVRDFESFLLLLKTIARERNLVVVFDEFQNFRFVDESIFATIQEFVDRAKFEEGLRLLMIAIGSIIGMMRNIFENREAPLYGRATAKISLKPFEFWRIRRLLRDHGLRSEEEIIEVYSMLGGMPRYYDTIDRLDLGLNKRSVIRFFTTKGYPGWKEVRDELIEEFRDAHPTYFSILEAISIGKCTSSEIADYTGIPHKSIHKYLNELANYFEIIEKRAPYGVKTGVRGARYHMKDPFYRFWFRYIFPNMDLIDLERVEHLRRHIEDDLPNHVGPVFEDIIRNTILAASGLQINDIKIPKINRIGAWWDRKGNEIDIVGGWGRRIILVGEITWSSKPYNIKDIEELIMKVEIAGIREPVIFVVAREGATRSAKAYIEEKGGHILTMKELVQIWDYLTYPPKE